MRKLKSFQQRRRVCQFQMTMLRTPSNQHNSDNKENNSSSTSFSTSAINKHGFKKV